MSAVLGMYRFSTQAYKLQTVDCSLRFAGRHNCVSEIAPSSLPPRVSGGRGKVEIGKCIHNLSRSESHCAVTRACELEYVLSPNSDKFTAQSVLKYAVC